MASDKNRRCIVVIASLGVQFTNCDSVLWSTSKNHEKFDLQWIQTARNQTVSINSSITNEDSVLIFYLENILRFLDRRCFKYSPFKMNKWINVSSGFRLWINDKRGFETTKGSALTNLLSGVCCDIAYLTNSALNKSFGSSVRSPIKHSRIYR